MPRSVHGARPWGWRGRLARREHPGRGASPLLGLVALAFAACAPPDTPDALRDPLPGAALDLLVPDTVRVADLHPGVRYTYLWSGRGPWAMHLVQADALSDRCDLGLEVLRAEDRERGRPGRERVSEMVARSRASVLVAVNADFFTPEGSTVGAEVVDGVVTRAEARPTFAWRRGSIPWMGVARMGADTLHLGWPVALSSDLVDGGTEAVGGFPDLVDGGHRVGDLEVGERPTFAAARHPRTAVGYDSGAGRLWLVVVDGRQPPHSAGMTLPELADVMEALGADEALNLDGGGSTTVIVTGRTVNRPSDPTGERPVVNALALVRTPAACLSLRR